MPKFFVFSDIHSFYQPFIEALAAAGYDRENPDHVLVGCGDYFDRGPSAEAVLNFLLEAPRCILVKGNHEDLLEAAAARGYFEYHDISNGTVDTVRQLNPTNDPDVDFALPFVMNKLQPLLDQMVNYFETKNYVFVHGWIPNREDWRWGRASEWRDARWVNGMDAVDDIQAEDKTIVCGHWHCSYGHAKAKGLPRWETEFGSSADFTPYYGDGIIAIDACTAHTDMVNVIVLEDDYLS